MRPPDGAWGIPKPDGSGDWNGMIGMVKRKVRKITLDAFFSSHNFSKFDFISQINSGDDFLSYEDVKDLYIEYIQKCNCNAFIL